MVAVVSTGVKLPTCADPKLPSLWMVAGHYDLPNFTLLRMLSVWCQPTEVSEVITWERLFMLHELHAQGVSISAIARQTGLDRKTVRRHLAAGTEPPVYGPRAPQGSLPGSLQGVSANPSCRVSGIIRCASFTGDYGAGLHRRLHPPDRLPADATAAAGNRL